MFHKSDRVVRTGESWTSAGLLLHQFFTQGVPALIATGIGTWIAAQAEALSEIGWPAWIFAGVLFAFLVLGTFSSVARLRLSWNANKAVGRGMKWNEAIFSPGAIIEGGTHTISEIFGNDGVRSHLLFRNCQIIGPGVVSLFLSPTEKCEISGVPVPVVFFINDEIAKVGNHVHQFHRCRFDNVTFYNVAVIIHPQNSFWLATHIFREINSNEPEKLPPPPDTVEETQQ